MRGRLPIAALLLLTAQPIAAAPRIAAADATLVRAKAEMVVDPRRVVVLVGEARGALAAAPRSPAQELASLRADWLESEALARLGELDRAQTLADAALRRVAAVEPGGQLHGDLLMTRGAVAMDKNATAQAFALFRQAHATFQQVGNTRAQAIALQNIGTIYSYAGDQRSVLRYYAQAADVHRSDPGLSQTAANNLGMAHKELGELDRAAAEFDTALRLAREMKSQVLEARVLTNLAAVSLARGRVDEAARFATRGLQVAQRGDAIEWAPFLWGVKGQIALARGNVPAAIPLFERAFQGLKLTETSFYFRDFHDSAARAYRAAGNLEVAFAHLQAFKRLDDEAREIRSSSNSALAAAQFDYSNQELRIAKLRQSELQARARQQLVLLVGALLLSAVTLAAFFRVRRSRNETRLANRQLETTNVALDRAVKAKSEFLATTSHEIRTPLNGILGMTQVLLGRRGIDATVRDQVRVIDSAGNTMKAIVDDILDMAQIEQGRVTVDRTDLRLPALVEEVTTLWRAAASAKGVTLTQDLADAPDAICEDERKLRQVLFNLLSNAVKFTAAGTIDVSVSTVQGDGGEQLQFAVRDTGIGIADDQLLAIFEPFRQADGSTTRQYGGTGLGLAISSKLADALDGTLVATSQPGVGSCFTLTLPLRRATIAAAVAAPQGRPTALANATVLILEANPLFASMMEASLAGAASSVKLADGSAGACADIVLVGEGIEPDEVVALRTALPAALLVSFGSEVGPTPFDGAIERKLPPLHLAPALEALLSTEVATSVAA